MAKGGYRPGSGRKKGEATIASEKARAFIAVETEKNLGPIIAKAIEQAIGGDQNARNFLFERGFGRVAQAVVTEDEDGNIIPLQTINITPIDDRPNT